MKPKDKEDFTLQTAKKDTGSPTRFSDSLPPAKTTQTKSKPSSHTPKKTIFGGGKSKTTTGSRGAVKCNKQQNRERW